MSCTLVDKLLPLIESYESHPPALRRGELFVVPLVWLIRFYLYAYKELVFFLYAGVGVTSLRNLVDKSFFNTFDLLLQYFPAWMF